MVPAKRAATFYVGASPPGESRFPMFLLYVTHDSGVVQLLTFPSAFDRSLVIITLAAQPVTLRCTEYAL